MEAHGTMVGSYDYCPTGNGADLPGGTVLTQQALNFPLRQGAAAYDDLKDYFHWNSAIEHPDHSRRFAFLIWLALHCGKALGRRVDLAGPFLRNGNCVDISRDHYCYPGRD